MQTAREIERLKGELQASTQALEAARVEAAANKERGEQALQSMRGEFEVEHRRRETVAAELDELRSTHTDKLGQKEVELKRLQDRFAQVEVSANQSEQECSRLQQEVASLQEQRGSFSVFLFGGNWAKMGLQ